MLLNRHVRRALRRRQLPISVYTVPNGYDTGTGRVLVPHNQIISTITPVLTTGVFQQPNKFDDSYSDDLKMLEEGERLQFEGVLWTEYPISVGEEGQSATNSDFIQVPMMENRLYKIFRIRKKFYGSFNRALLGAIDA